MTAAGPSNTPGSGALARELRDLAVQMASDAGALAVEQRNAAIQSAETKSSATDIVTAADKAAEELIVQTLISARPDDAIVGEEGTNRTGTTGLRWFIDPIDGTTNFFYGLPGWAVSVAVGDENGMLAGAVLDPSSATVYDAFRGGGARANGDPIRARPPTPLAHALVATGFGYSPERRVHQAQVLEQVIGSVRDIRRFGAAAMELCHLAAGRVDAYFEQGLNDWDLAAGLLIASEAGARVEVLADHEPGPHFLLGATPAIFDTLQSLLTDAGALSGP